ncbi:MAG: class I SAM-dependent methyltransferase [Tabrizicola sp.]|jgi:SAM-dependent methyltransferase|nr:class I SAM-dependent methyltransferase [Tabrizicola sp.]
MSKRALNYMHANMVFSRRIRVLSGHIASHLSDGSVLDVGCGDGTLAQAVMAQRPNLSFQGIDVFLRPSVAIPAQVYDGQTIPFPDQSFDWVTICDVLHHTDDPAAVLAECARVVRRGVVIKDHLREGLLAGPVLRFMDWVGNRGHDVRLPYNYLSRAEWDAIFAKIGMKPARWDQSLGIYPAPFTYLFDRSLHFVATLAK